MFEVAPKDHKLQDFGQPSAAVSIGMCVAEQINAGMHPIIWDCQDWPTKCCCEHTHLCCRVYQFRAAPKCQAIQWFGRSIAAASTHVCCRMYQVRVPAPSFKGDKSLAHRLLLRAYTCALKKGISFQAAPKRYTLKWFRRSVSAARTHMSVMKNTSTS